MYKSVLFIALYSRAGALKDWSAHAIHARRPRCAHCGTMAHAQAALSAGAISGLSRANLGVINSSTSTKFTPRNLPVPTCTPTYPRPTHPSPQLLVSYQSANRIGSSDGAVLYLARMAEVEQTKSTLLSLIALAEMQRRAARRAANARHRAHSGGRGDWISVHESAGDYISMDELATVREEVLRQWPELTPQVAACSPSSVCADRQPHERVFTMGACLVWRCTIA